MESLSRNKLKWVSSLRLKKNRDSEKLFLVEGEKAVIELIRDFNELVALIIATRTDFQHPLAYSVSEQEMKKISQFKTPSGLMAIVRYPEVFPSNTSLILAIDGVQDPGNMGTILRTADWFGVDHILCSNETVDVYNPKVVQASMASVFRLKVEYCDLTSRLRAMQKPIYGALLNGKNIYDTVLENDAVIVVGNEGNGITPSVEALVGRPLFIPGKNRAESLNVGVATGIILAEFSKLS